MRQYFIDFMDGYNYDVEDISALVEAYDKIKENSVAREIFDSIIETYNSDCNCDFAPIIEAFPKIAEAADIHEYTAAFIVFSCLTKRTRELYKTNGISDDIFVRSFFDLKYKLDTCKKVKGVRGTYVYTWYPRFYNLTRFALGRLQYDVKPIEHDYDDGVHSLKTGDTVLGIHIPDDGTPLSPESVHDSFDRAAKFFRERIGDTPVAVCRTWLLWPEHEKFLKPTSNILRFMNEFTMIDVGTYSEHIHALTFIFDSEERNPDLLPADSTIRRAYIGMMREGKYGGWGYGIRFL